MSSDLQSAVESLQLNNYISLVIVAAVAYDYILTLPNEINHVWSKPWTFVSTMFILVRYPGLAAALINTVCTVLLIASDCLFIIFLAAADLVMILRVYAIYGRSRIILAVLLMFYAATIVLYSISSAYYNNLDTNLTVTISQVLDMSFCNPIFGGSHKLGVYKRIPRLTLAALLLILAVSRLCMEWVQSYRISKEIQVNKYISLVVSEGIFYFLAHLLYNIDFPQTVFGMAMSTLSFILFFILSPRFIINIREMHEHELCHSSRRATGLDTGFGFRSNVQSSQNLTETSLASASRSGRTFTEGDVEMQVVLGSETSSKHQ